MFYGVLAGLAAGALWGFVFIVPRMVPNFSPVDLTVGRLVSYGALSFALMISMRQSAWPTVRQAFSVFGLSVLGFTGYYLLLVLAIRDAGTAATSLIIGSIPIWMMLLGKPAELHLAALLPKPILTLLGLALMMRAETNVSALGQDFWRGVAFAVASMVCWTAFVLLNAAWLKRHPSISATTWVNWLGVATGVGALELWIAVGSDTNMLLVQQNRVQEVLICIATGVGSAWLATILWNTASQRLSVSLCG